MEESSVSPAVLITIADGGIDYISCGDVNVVVLDFDDMCTQNVGDFMPVDIDDTIKEVEALPDGILWKEDLVKRLKEFHAEVEAHVFK